MKPTVLGIILVLVLLLGGVYLMTKKEPAAVPSVVNTYENQQYGVGFSYPGGYLSSEVPSQERYTITLVKEADAAPVENGEGPTAITIDIVSGASTTQEWLATSASNYALGDGTYVETSVAGASAVRYSWSGLYEGETTAFMHNGRVIALSVTYLTPADQIRADYEALLASVTLQ